MRGCISIALFGLLACSSQASTEPQSPAPSPAPAEVSEPLPTAPAQPLVPAAPAAPVAVEADKTPEAAAPAEAEADADADAEHKPRGKDGPRERAATARPPKARPVDGPAAEGPASPVEPAPVPEPKVAPSEPTPATEPCGEKGQRMCPLQAWMEKHLQLPMDDGDGAKLASGLRKAVEFVPEPAWKQGPKGWATFSQSGVEAAEAGDMKAVKRSCKGCHKAWRKKYKAAHRMRAVP